MVAAAFKLRTPRTQRSDIDADEVRRAALVLFDPAHAVEVRALPSGAARILAAGDPAALVKAVDDLAGGATGVYYTLNPVNKGLAGERKCAKKADIIARRWLLLDVDPAKPERHKDDSATDEEKQAAFLVAQAAVEYLDSCGWPVPALVDSGNGWHVLYRVDLPASDHSQALVRAVLKALSERFSGPRGVIDRAVHNAGRIAKLPGTWARKGVASDERPHRPVRLVYHPERIECVTAEQLAAVGGMGDRPESTNGNGPHEREEGEAFRVRASAGDARAYARAALDREAARIRLAQPGAAEGRNNAYNRAVYAMAQLVAGGCILKQEVEARLKMEARLAGLGQHEIDATWESAFEAGSQHPRRPEPKGDKPKADKADKPKDKKDGPLIILASEIQPKKINWLWPGRIPLGKLTTFAGVGGLGKTFVLCDISSRVSRGMEWPHSGGACSDGGRVLFVSGEDDYDDTLVPRLITQGADLSRVAFLRTDVSDTFTLADLETLDRAVEQLKDVRFVAIDPPTAYLGGVDDHRNAELRGLLSPMKSWAAKRRLAVVFNTHVNKPQGQKVEAMMRVMGSVAWVNAVRAAHMFAKDPEDRTKRLFIGMKINVGKERQGLRYQLVDAGEDLARVEWLGEVDLSADEAVNQAADRRKRKVVAAEWLADLMPAGAEEVPSQTIWKAKDDTTLSRDAVLEAKEQMGIKAKQATDRDGCRVWVWYWPPEARQRWQEQQGQAPQEQAF